MAYIGNTPLDVRSFGSTKFEFTATAGQTAFTGTDDNNITLAFTEDQIEVYVNGVLMDNSDFSSSGGNTVTLGAAAAVNDIVTVIAAKTNVPNVDYVAATGGTFTGAISGTSADFDGGVTIDNITIDGTEIDLSSGDFTLDVAGDIILDADGADIIFKDGGTQIGRIRNVSSGEFTFQSDVSDKDIVFNGNDGGSTVTALTLDMSAAGAAAFNAGATFGGNVGVNTSSPTSYANSQATLVVEDTGSPAIAWSDTGQAKDWFAVAQGSGLFFNYGDGGGAGSASNVTNVLTLDNSGKVGIGTDSPSFETGGGLEVNYSAGNGAHLKLTDAASGAGGTNGFDIYAFNTSGYIENYESGSLIFRNGGSERMKIDSAGRVGINASPAAVADSTGVAVLQNGATFLIHFDPDGSGTTSLSNNMYFDGSNNKALFYGSTSQYYQTGGIHHFRKSGITSAGGTASMSEIVRLDGDGIKFNGDTAGANALSDYEEGTCTITLASTGVNPSFSSGGTFTATYCKIGKTVTVHGYTGAATITSAGTGIAKVTGLPFAMRSGSYSMAHFTHSTLFGASQHGYIETGQTFFYPIVNGSTAGVNYSTGTFYMMFTATYVTN